MDGKILDLDDFMGRVQDDKELLFELLDIFMQDFRTKREELEKAIKSNDSQTVEHVAHFLKGSCGNISAEKLRRIFFEFEEKGAKGDLEGLAEQLKDIDKDYEELVIYIGDLRNRL